MTSIKDEKPGMANYDFQKGDKVYDLMFGNGVVVDVLDYTPNSDAIIQVHFSKSNPYSDACFFEDGKFQHFSGVYERMEVESDTSVNRTLFHGHDILKKIKKAKTSKNGWGRKFIEIPPVRHPWVNVFMDSDLRPWCGGIHTTKEEAEKSIQKGIHDYEFYIKTIQLKPDEETQ